MADRRREGEFTEFARGQQQRMYRRAYLLTGSREEAQDLVQTTLVKLYVAWPRVDQPAAYAYRVLVRAFLDGRRRSERERALHVPIEPAAPPPDPDRALTLLAALAELPPRTRAAVVLRYWEDLPVAQAAAALGCTPGTVKSLSSRGLALLRDLLGETFEEPVTEGATR
ncbi:SigE family RNA polymerase sigma factor [Nocardioides sp. SYSU D00038]|uniref:SigE family RNA polymerase sigma factor n=1 Tax=Nocardioides sp. SYSU D00038 TaxID=2812554 RepID=UPI0019682A2B|nr:SigE family RNA polymerase sigma factor [Nocardioides sp. SYSU D00038]